MAFGWSVGCSSSSPPTHPGNAPEGASLGSVLLSSTWCFPGTTASHRGSARIRIPQNSYVLGPRGVPWQILGLPGEAPGELLGLPGEVPGEAPGEVPGELLGLPGEVPGEAPGEVPRGTFGAARGASQAVLGEPWDFSGKSSAKLPDTLRIQGRESSR